MAELYPDLRDRPVKETICLFDVDDTLTPARRKVSAEMLKLLSEVRHKCAIGYVRQFSSVAFSAWKAQIMPTWPPVYLKYGDRNLQPADLVICRLAGPT